MKIPVITLNTCNHVGELDINKKGRHGDSLEGHLLSVSKCPHAWKQIVKLGGFPVHTLSKANAVFIAAHNLHDDIRAHIIEYGLHNNLIEPSERYRGWFYEDCDDTWYYSDYKTAQDALYEVDSCGEYDTAEDVPGPDGHRGIELVQIHAGTSKLADLVQTPSAEGRDAFDYLLIAWAQQFAHIDGIWWDDRYDPCGYSAPRGGIFPDRLWSWSIQETPWAHVAEETEKQPVLHLDLPTQKSHLAVASPELNSY